MYVFHIYNNLGILLGYNLTEVNDMKNQYDSQYPTNLKDLTKFVSSIFSINCKLVISFFLYAARCQSFRTIQ